MLLLFANVLPRGQGYYILPLFTAFQPISYNLLPALHICFFTLSTLSTASQGISQGVKMSTQTQSFASLDHFVFDLRSQLRGQAKDGLEDLERQLSEIGYGWLDNYVGEAVASSSK